MLMIFLFIGLFFIRNVTPLDFLSNLFGEDHSEFPADYGVDVTFPIHHHINRLKYGYFYRRYNEIMKGCYTKYNYEACASCETTRLNMNFDQPRHQHNYTEIGFKKLKAPEEVFKAVQDFYIRNKDSRRLEEWPAGYTYVNTWTSPTYMVSFEDSGLRGGLQIKQLLWSTLQPIIEEWVGYPVQPTSLYGIRIYEEHAILATHVDRLPLVSSVILQVDQQGLVEPWPIEVYDHHGRAHNVTMVPGEMVLYESHTVLHGRPFPMRGRGASYANVFIHFQPVEHERLNQLDGHHDQLHQEETVSRSWSAWLSSLFTGWTTTDSQAEGHGTTGRRIGGHEADNHIHAAQQQQHDDPFRRKFTFDSQEEEAKEAEAKDKEGDGGEGKTEQKLKEEEQVKQSIIEAAKEEDEETKEDVIEVPKEEEASSNNEAASAVE